MSVGVIGLVKLTAIVSILFTGVFAISAVSSLIFAYHTYSVTIEDLRLAKSDGYSVMEAKVNVHGQTDSKLCFNFLLDDKQVHNWCSSFRNGYNDWVAGIVYPSAGSHTLRVDVSQYDYQDVRRSSDSKQKTVTWSELTTQPSQPSTPTATATVTVPPTPTTAATTPASQANVRIESVWLDPSEPRQGETFRVRVRFNVEGDPRVRLNLYIDGSWKDWREETFSRGTYEREFVRGDLLSTGSHDARVEAFVEGMQKDSKTVSFSVRSDGVSGRSDIDVRVRDNRDSRDISSARVELLRSGILRDWKHTDSSGRATFYSYEAGCYDVKASHGDYIDRTVSRCFDVGERPEVSIWLDRRDSSSATIRVTVRDTSTNSGLSDALVEISGARSNSARTSSSGEARFDSLPSGSYTVRVSRTDYNSANQSLSLNANDFRDVTFSLSRTTATTTSTTPNQAPIAELVITPSTSVIDTQSVTLDGSRSRDDDGRIVTYEFLDGSTTLQSGSSSSLSRTFSPGTHVITLRVTDDRNSRSTTQQTLSVSTATTTSTRNLIVIVRDKDTSERISDARVFVNGQSGYTGSDGTKSFSVSQRCYDVEASKTGYTTEVVNKCVGSSDESVTIYIKSTVAATTVSASAVKTFAGHDLAIASTSHPFEVVAGQQFVVSVRIRNQGEFYESGINLDGTIGSNSARIGSFALGSGSETTQTLTLTAPSKSGSYSLSIKVWNPYDEQTIINEVRVVGETSYSGSSGVSGVARLRTDVRFDTTSVNVEQFRSDVINVRVTNFLPRAEVFKLSTDLPGSVAYSPPPERIEPGETKVLTLYVAPKDIGTYRGVVRVAAGEEQIAEQLVSVYAGDFKAREPDAPKGKVEGSNFFEQVALPVYVGLGGIAVVMLVMFSLPLFQQRRGSVSKGVPGIAQSEKNHYYVVPEERIVE